jgi:hypothetical protein
MNAKRIHPTSYHQHIGAFRAETARYEGFLGCGVAYCKVGYRKQVGCKTTLGRYG